MRLSRLRAALVLVAALLHLGGGVVSALAPCCDMTEAHASGGPAMECCLKGGPNHVCPFMSKGARKKAAAGGSISASCVLGHDQGVPAMGFAGIAVEATIITAPELIASAAHATAESAITFSPHTPSPPPRA